MFFSSQLIVFFIIYNIFYAVNSQNTAFGDTDDEEIKHFLNLIANLNVNEIPESTPELQTAYKNLFTTVDFPPLDPEAEMTAKEIINYHGYPVQEYVVETDDGYLITVQRIPFGKNGFGTEPRKPVLLQHGLLAVSTAWVVNTPDKNLPYMLADAGYDVWLGNVRGNKYGYNHTHLSPQDKVFWEFSFDEMAKYDIPAIIGTMLKETGFKQIHYIGHSMGTTILLALLSTQPMYNNVIKAGFMMAPVISGSNAKGLIVEMSKLYPDLRLLIDLIFNGEISLNNKYIKYLARTICNCELRDLCAHVFFLFAGFDYQQTNVTRYPVYMYHVPDSTSNQNFNHFEQLKNSSRFQYYDYGTKGNLEHYNMTVPPFYNISKITTPISVFWSDNDYLADPKDVATLASLLQNVPLIYRVPFHKFNHIDYMWAIDIKSLIADKLIEIMKKLWP